MRADANLMPSIFLVQKQECPEQYGPDSVLPAPRQR